MIYLTRDPRGSINSLLQSPEFWTGQKFANVTFACDRLHSDIQAANEILKNGKINSRFKVVRYEDIVDRSTETVSSIYSFIGAKILLPYAFQYIDEHQMNAIDIDQYYSIPNHHNHSLSLKIINPKERNLYVNALFKTGKLKSSSTHNISNSNNSVLEQAILQAFISREITNKYYSQNRIRGFKHDHWKHELPKDYLYNIEHQSNCIQSMKILGYM